MTTRHIGYVVTLDDSVREDECDGVVHALLMVKGVVTVRPVEDGYEQVMARDRIKGEIYSELMETIMKFFKKGG